MDYYAGIDVSLEASSICVVDGAGKIAREAKIASEPAALIGWFAAVDGAMFDAQKASSTVPVAA